MRRASLVEPDTMLYGYASPQRGASGGDDRAADDDDTLERDTTWHNPTLMQMVETLQTVMMAKRDPLAPVPVR